jgi:hypothetical protein
LTYAQVVKEGWARFWDFPLYHYDPIPTAVPSWASWFTQNPPQTAANVLFGLSILGSALMFLVRRNFSRVSRPIPFPEMWFITATVLFAALVTSLTNFQDNARLHTYVLPLEYASIVLCIYAGWRTVSSIVGRAAENSTAAKGGIHWA